MRILYIDSVCKSGSTGKIVYKLYTEVRSHGDEAAVCYGRGKNVEEENILKFGLDWGDGASRRAHARDGADGVLFLLLHAAAAALYGQLHAGYRAPA